MAENILGFLMVFFVLKIVLIYFKWIYIIRMHLKEIAVHLVGFIRILRIPEPWKIGTSENSTTVSCRLTMSIKWKKNHKFYKIICTSWDTFFHSTIFYFNLNFISEKNATLYLQFQLHPIGSGVVFINWKWFFTEFCFVLKKKKLLFLSA